jgi:lysylphosphatidylglycerol synthetase-like protein (DUF2156 family)
LYIFWAVSLRKMSLKNIHCLENKFRLCTQNMIKKNCFNPTEIKAHPSTKGAIKMHREIHAETPLLKERAIDDFQTVVKIVRKWGDVNTDGILDSCCKIFSVPTIEGLIGYRIECRNAIVFGDPLCAPENKGALALAFQHYCEEQKLGVVYTIVSEEFTYWGVEHLSGALIEFGDKFVLDPFNNPMDNTGSKAVLVRKKIKQALRNEAVVQEYFGKDLFLEQKIEEVADGWLQSRKGLQVYLSKINLFKNPYGKRWFYAKHKENIVGILTLNDLQSHQGWLLNNLMITPEAPSGTSELLVISALEVLKKENCRFVLVGPVPAKQLGEIIGLNPLSTAFVRGLFTCAKKILRLEGHGVFWEKFQPTLQKSYLLFPKKNLRFSSIKALFQAFNVGR